MADGPWFWCLKHHTVEPKDGCAERHRLGPYDTREEAEHALQSVAERKEQLDGGGPGLGRGPASPCPLRGVPA